MAQQSAANVLSTLDGLFKERFAERLENAIPEITDIQVQVPFKAEKRLGLKFRQPVILGREHGCTYITQGDGLVTLATSIAGQIKPAEVVGAQHVFRGQIDYASIFEGENLDQAFDNAVGVMVRNLLESHRMRLEVDLFWGQDVNGLGTVASRTTGAGGNIVIVTAQWASGLWNGMEQAILEFFSPALTTQRTAGSLTAQIVAVDADLRQITFGSDVGPPALGLPTDVAVSDVVFLKGQRTTSAFKTQVGLHTILNTTSGVLFNVNATNFSLWRGNVFSAGSVDLAFEHCLKGFAKASVKGATGDYILYVNPTTFANQMADQGALRRYDRSDSPAKYEVGAKSITFYTQTGSIEIKGHPMEKEGFAHGWAKRLFKRVGSTDITFDTTKMEGIDRGANQFFLPIPDKNGVEIRSFDDQALFTDAVGKSFIINNIVNS